MRALVLATVFGVVSLAGAAAADPWTDPNGNLTIDAPRGWTVRPHPMQGAGSAVLAFTASSDCFFLVIPNPATATSTVAAARNSTTPLAASAWVQATHGIPDLFDDGAPTLVSQSVDTSGFWPVQRAELQSGSRTVHGALQVRPGFELRGFCVGSPSSYEALLNSMGHPRDQAWQQSAD